MTGTDDPNDDNALAAEYVLRLLDVDEHRAFEDRLREDARLNELVRDWEKSFASVADEVAPVRPPAHLKAKIMNVIAPDTARAPKGRWQWLAGLGALGVAALIAFVLLGPILRSPGDLSPSFQAELASSDGALVLTAGVIPATHEIIIDRLVGAPSEGRVFELWLIALGSSTPVSLGVLEAEGTTRIRVPDDIAPGVRTGTIAISDEPPGGSPTGVPTGEILATATFTDV
ncbi:anti-sigma factor [Rhodobacteraceae bacterium]|nr:anti-sigma factor [Paracoccaceae bacterium]